MSDSDKIKSVLSNVYEGYRISSWDTHKGYYPCYIPQHVFNKAGGEKAMPAILEWQGFGLFVNENDIWVTCLVRLKLEMEGL